MSDIIFSFRKPTSLEVQAAKLRKQKRDRLTVVALGVVLIGLAVALGRI
jgi:hypothetical protein